MFSFSKTQKAILAAGLAINLATIATVGVVMHRREVQAHTFQLGTIVVTPADVERRVAADGTIEMVLPPVVVTAADTGATEYAASGQSRDADDSLASEVLFQTLDTLSPGQYLESSLSLDVLGTLAFDRAGR